MAVLLTLDASVFVAACRRHEVGHAASRALLAAIREAETPLIEPTILPVEIAAALRRADGDAVRARELAEAVMALPNLTLTAVDARFARRAVALATECRLRGADALYVAVAHHYGAHLITLDAEQLERAPSRVHACSPGDWHKATPP